MPVGVPSFTVCSPILAALLLCALALNSDYILSDYISQFRALNVRLDRTIAEVDATNIPYFLVGHVGDGNFHFGYLIDPNLPEERRIAEALNHKLVARALALEGTCTGEHGVGLHKMDFLVTEAGVGAVDMMRTIKRALDPKNIMNPGKIFSI